MLRRAAAPLRPKFCVRGFFNACWYSCLCTAAAAEVAAAVAILRSHRLSNTSHDLSSILPPLLIGSSNVVSGLRSLKPSHATRRSPLAFSSERNTRGMYCLLALCLVFHDWGPVLRLPLLLLPPLPLPRSLPRPAPLPPPLPPALPLSRSCAFPFPLPRFAFFVRDNFALPDQSTTLPSVPKPSLKDA